MFDRAENHGAERKGVLTQEVELKSRRLRTRITPKPVPNHLLKKDQFVDDLFNLHHLPDQPKSGSVCVVRCVRTNPDFSKSIFSSQITGNEVFNFISKIRHHWKG